MLTLHDLSAHQDDTREHPRGASPSVEELCPYGLKTLCLQYLLLSIGYSVLVPFQP